MKLSIRQANGTETLVEVGPEGLKLAAQRGCTYRIVDEFTMKTPRTAIVKRVDDDLLLDGGTPQAEAVQLTGFFDECRPGDRCYAVLDTPRGNTGEPEGTVTITQDGEQAAGALLPGQSALLWPGQAFMLAPGHAIERTTAADSPAAANEDNHWGRIALGALGLGALGGLAGGGGGGGQSAAPEALTIKGVVVAGPMQASTVEVLAYDKDGVLLGRTLVGNSGDYEISVAGRGGYTGPVLLVARDVDDSAANNYIDERTGELTNLGASLAALGVAAVPTNLMTINITPLTQLAAHQLGMNADAGGAALAPPTDTAAITAANKAVGELFGVTNILGNVVTILDPGYHDAHGDPAAYGAALARLSQMDAHYGSIANTLAHVSDLIAAGNVGDLTQLSTSRTLPSATNRAAAEAAQDALGLGPVNATHADDAKVAMALSANAIGGDIVHFTVTGPSGSVLVVERTVTADDVERGHVIFTIGREALAQAGSGTLVPSVVVTDSEGGNGSPLIAGAAFIADLVPPTAVATIDGLSNDTGLAGDFRTTVAVQTVNGHYSGTLGSGERIEVSADGVSWVTATLGGDAQWSAAGVTLRAGTQTLQVRVIDAAGNTRDGANQACTLDASRIDTTAVITAADDDAPVHQSFTGALSTGSSTDDTTPTLRGTLSAALADGDVLAVYDTQGDVTARIGEAAVNGTRWTFSTATLASGTHAFFVRVERPASGASSDASTELTLHEQAVTIAISAQTSSPRQPVVEGTLASSMLGDGEVIAVYVDGERVGQAQRSSTHWQFALPSALADGTHTLVARIEDEGTHEGRVISSALAWTVGPEPVVDAPALTVAAASGGEDQAIGLSISASLVTPVTGETLAITISGVPAGAILSTGTNNGDGTWSLTPAQLSGLTFTPPADYSGSIALTVTATAGVGGTQATSTASLAVTVAPVADAPALTVAPASGLEDQPMALAIAAALVSPATGETLSITISGMPSGAALSAGTDNGDGTWSLTPAQLSGLAITPPADYSGSIALTVTATASVGGTQATSTASLAVTVAPVADAPTLTVAPASGLEDQPIALAIAAALVSPATGETLSITIAGMPSGATLSAGTDNGDGTWSLTAAQLSGLTLTPPADYSGSIALTVTAIASAGGTQATSTASLAVTVSPVADAPTLTVAPASGLEDQPIALTIAAALVSPATGETLSITIAGMPSGAALSAGTDNGDGTWSLTAAQLSGLTLTPPPDYSGSIALTVTATADLGGTQATSTASLAVTVAPVADAPTLTVAPASGLEDQPVALTIAAALASPATGETLGITIAGMPSGATLSAGTNNGDGTWRLTPAQLAGLTLTPPANYSGSIALTVTATAGVGSTQATSSASLAVTVAPVADAPTLTVAPASGLEDQPIALAIAAALTSPAAGETVSMTVAGVPAGATLSAGTDNGDGTWTLTSAQLAGLTLTPPADYSGSITLAVSATSQVGGSQATTSHNLAVTVTPVPDAPSVTVAPAASIANTATALTISPAWEDTDGSEATSLTISGVPAGASFNRGKLVTIAADGSTTWSLTAGDVTGLTLTPAHDAFGHFSLAVNAISTELANGTEATAGAALAVTIADVRGAPNLNHGDSTIVLASASGLEDQPLALDLSSAIGALRLGAELQAVAIAGLPAGAVLNHGALQVDGSWLLAPADLSGLTLTTAANDSPSFTLTVSYGAGFGAQATTINGTLGVSIAGVADTPTLSVSNVSTAYRTAAPLTISGALADSSESLSYIISGVPNGAILSAGLQNGNGSWSLLPAQLSGLTITPPIGYSGVMALGVTAQALEPGGSSASVTQTLNVTVAAEVPPVLTGLMLTPVSGQEDTAITIGTSLVGMNMLGALSATFSGVPSGATLSAGTRNGNGTWTVGTSLLSTLKLTPAANDASDITLGISVKVLGITTQIGILNVRVDAVADQPSVSFSAPAGTEDQSLALTIGGSLADTDGSESLSFVVSGLPAGSRLSAGRYNATTGEWLLSSADLTGLTLQPPANLSGTLGFQVAAVATELEGSRNVKTQNVSVTLTAASDAPLLHLTAAQGAEDTTIPLSIGAVLSDTDGSESITGVTISGLPAGATLNHGTALGGGAYQLTTAQLSGLALTPPAHFTGDFSLSVSATSQDGSATPATTSGSLDVSVAPVVLPPLLTVPELTVAGGTVDLSGVAVSGDAGESLAVTFANLPTGAVLSAGTNNGNHSWTVGSDELASLRMTLPAGFNGPLNVAVVATAHEGSSQAINGMFTVSGDHQLLDLTLLDGQAQPRTATIRLGNHDNGVKLALEDVLQSGSTDAFNAGTGWSGVNGSGKQQVVIEGDSGSVTMTNGSWSHTGTVSHGGQDYAVYEDSTHMAQLLIDANLSRIGPFGV